MPMLELAITGPDATQAAEALEDILTQETDLRPKRHLKPPIQAQGEKVIDPVAVAALVVSIPCGILAVIDLADRIRKRQKAKALTEKASALVINGNVTITVTIHGSGVPTPLHSMTPDQVLELAGRAASVSSSPK